MSNPNTHDTAKSKPAEADKSTELKDAELDEVSGGAFVNTGATRTDIFSGQGGGSGFTGGGTVAEDDQIVTIHIGRI